MSPQQRFASLTELLDQATAFHQNGKLAEAERLYLQILRTKPAHFHARHFLGFLRFQQGQYAKALELLDAALKINPNACPVYYHRGNTLLNLHRFDEALASYDKALAIEPSYVEVLISRGNALRSLGRLDEALTNYDKALALKPDYVDAFYNRGLILQELGRFEEAATSYDKALAIAPKHVEALNNRGNTLHELRRFDEALTSYDRALAIRPSHIEAIYNRGNTLESLKRFEEALTCYDKVLAIAANQPKASNDPSSALSTVSDLAFIGLANSALSVCDWARTEKITADIEARVGNGKFMSPFAFLGYSADARLQRQCAETYIQKQIPSPPPPLWDGTTYRHDKIRVAYLSSDFQDHPVAHLIAELLELHDRSRFETLGISFGGDDGSDMRARLTKAFDQFYDVRSKSDRDIARQLNELQADIAVDLQGHTKNSRPGIFAHRPAPIQVNYLGYPGTVGADFMDYVIADRIVLPLDQQPFFTEKIVHLPDCYLVSDSKRTIPVHTPLRQEVGLPEKGFVFCCFNNNWKITSPIFDIWMRLLRSIDGSVLWLAEANKGARDNLCYEAGKRGVDPNRLVFARREKLLADHLARHRLADLFLDTLPYNAHATASDALWMGLPLVTCYGEAFAGRVAASLLQAIGLPELVTKNLADYEILATRLAMDPSLLQSSRQKLEDNRLRQPLFDTHRFRQDIEAAYTTMWEIWQRGETPQAFGV